ncbi:MAG: hypothetical protein IJJ26_07480 [Victivallales bacterium]|nr:hypothetical protein [Victivallales bacterium]
MKLLAIAAMSTSLLAATSPILLDNGGLALRFSEKDGALQEMSAHGTSIPVAPGNQYNIRTKDGANVFSEQSSPFSLIHHTVTETTEGKLLQMDLAAPGWRLEVQV